MKQFCLLLVLTAVVFLSAQRASACSCAFGGGGVCQDYWEVSAVFVGTVIDSRRVTVKAESYERQMRSVRLSLDDSFRGVEGAEVEVMTGFGGGDCGFGFRQTQQYLVFAHRNEKDGKLYTGICTRTKAVSEADKDLAYIRGLAKAKPGATISGEIVRYQRDKEGSLANQPLPGVKVRIVGSKTIEVADEKGEYRVENLAAGDYTVTAIPPARLTAPELEKKIKAYDRGCTIVSFWLESNAQISGRVLNPQGLAVPRAEIFLMNADKPKYQGHWDAAYADEEGKYLLKRIPPARYVLMVRFDGLTGQNRPFPATYYPGVSELSQAKVFSIEEGQIETHDLIMPPLPRESEIQGTVTWSNGTPATTARVEYMEANAGVVVYGAKVDDQGRFTIKAYDGLKLGLRATIERSGKHLYSNSVQVTVGAGREQVKLVIPDS